MLRVLSTIFKNLLAGLRTMRCGRKQRCMRLCETLPLGDRRYLALVEIDGRRFLVGAAANSLSLLARLPSPPDPFTGAVPDAMFNPEEYTLCR